MEANKTLRDLVYDLDWNVGGILCTIETLDDLSVTLNHLRQDMDTLGEEKARLYFREWSRTIRIVDELMRRSLNEFSSTYEAVEDVRSVMFKKIVKEESVLEKGQRPSTNTLDGWNWFAMDNNIAVFMKEFGRLPESFEEAATYIHETVAKVRTSSENEKADLLTSNSN